MTRYPASPADQAVSGRRLICQDVWSLDLPEKSGAGMDVIAGTPECHTRTLHRLHSTEAGLWQMTAGVVRDVEVDELFVVLEGAGSLRFEDGEELALIPGTMVRLRAGEQVEWTVTHRLRKLYFTI